MFKKVIFFSALLLAAGCLMLYIVDSKGSLFVAKMTIYVSLFIPVTFYIFTKIIGAKKSKALFANLLLLSVTVIVMLVVAEVFLRYLYADITTTRDNSSYFAKRWKQAEQPVINSLGFREREIVKKKPENIYRIAVVGDSFTYGQGITEDERFSNVIERELNSAEKKYEVLNFGIAGAETIDHIDFLDDVFEVDPDFILLQWFPGDVEGRDKSMRPKPYPLIPSDYLTGLLHHNSVLFYLVNDRWVEIQRTFGILDSYEKNLIARFGDNESSNSVRANSQLNEFITKVKNKNVQLGIVAFPIISYVGGDESKYPFGFLFDRVIYACEAQAIKCVDMRSEFAKVEPVSGLWVNKFDHHPSALANKIAAEAIMKKFGWETK